MKHLPNHPELLFELGRLFDENRKDPVRARNLWLRAAEVSPGRNPDAKDEEKYILQQIEAHLAKLEERAGNLTLAIQHWEKLKARLPDPGPIDARIKEVRNHLEAQRAAGLRAEPAESHRAKP